MTTPNVYFAGNTLASMIRTDLSVTEVTTSGHFDSAFVSSAISLPVASSQALTPVLSVTGTFWVHHEHYTGGAPVNNAQPVWLLNGATNIFRLNCLGATTQPQYWNGSAWTNTGTAFAWTTNGAITIFDIKIILNSGFEVWLNGVMVASGSGWSGSSTTMTQVQFQRAANATCEISQIIVSPDSTVDMKYSTIAINGNSASNTGAASGVYTDVNETNLNDATAISITTSGNKAGQTHGTLTLPGGYQIAAVALSARGRQDGVITDGKLGFRIGSTNYSSAGLSFSGVGYGPRQRIDTVDPSTSAQWTASGVNAAEVYLEAA